jgi:carboxyl-terminal processing protease
MNQFGLILFYLVFSVITSYPYLFAKLPVNSELQPTPLMQQETKWLVQALQQAHFNKVSIRELNPEDFIESYLSKLDRLKLYFTKGDSKSFSSKFSPTLITFFEQGNLFPGFEIYNFYKTKSLSRLEWVTNFLNEDFKFESNRTYFTNREDGPWDDSEMQLNETWKKLIEFEILSEALSTVDTNMTDKIYNNGDLIEIIGDSKEKVKKRYERWKKSIVEFESTDVQELYLSTLTQMFDPHTTFMNIKEKEKFDQTMNNELVGIGAVLTDDDGYCTITELLPGGPAESSRELNPKDKIVKVAQAEGEFVNVVDMKLSKIVELIKGPKDTLVRLEVKPVNDPSSTKIVRIIRDKIKLTSNLASASIHKVTLEKKERKIGVIELRSFYGSSGNGPKATDDVEELIQKLKIEEVEGVILDLRRNGGGYLSEAVNLAGLFISRGPVVQVKSTDGKIRKKFDFNPKLAWDGPLIVLVSRYSASASEIVAGALQNHKRAIIVGDKTTHGKGTVQSLIQMNLPFNFSSSSKKSAAKITIQKYYLPSGKSTQIQGVESDISMPTINTFLPIGESDLENALPCDSITPVNFRRSADEFVYKTEVVDLLNDASNERQNSLSEFIYLNKNVNWYKKKREDKNLSLNFKNRFTKKVEDQDFTKRMNDEFEKLSKDAFPKKSISLNIVESQNLKSRLVRGEESQEDNSTNSFSLPENFDIRLHESCRIMSDWVNIIESKQLSLKEQETSEEI